MQIGDRVRFWTRKECQTYQRTKEINYVAPKDMGHKWGEEAIIVGFENDLVRLKFDNGEIRTVGSVAVKYLFPDINLDFEPEYKVAILRWQAFFEGDS